MSGYDKFGKPQLSVSFNERCAILEMEFGEFKTSLRADSSGSRSNAEELETKVAKLLLTNRTRANIEDVILVAGILMRIVGKTPKFDLDGTLDHYEIMCKLWTQ